MVGQEQRLSLTKMVGTESLVRPMKLPEWGPRKGQLLELVAIRRARKDKEDGVSLTTKGCPRKRSRATT